MRKTITKQEYRELIEGYLFAAVEITEYDGKWYWVLRVGSNACEYETLDEVGYTSQEKCHNAALYQLQHSTHHSQAAKGLANEYLQFHKLKVV